MQGRRNHQAEFNIADGVTHLALGFYDISNHAWEWSVITNAAGQEKLDSLPDTLAHDSRREDTLSHCVFDTSATAHPIDGAQMMFVTCFDQVTFLQMYAQACAEQRLFDVVGCQGITGEKFVNITALNQPTDMLTAAGMHDGGSANK